MLKINKLTDERKVEINRRFKSVYIMLLFGGLFIVSAFFADSRDKKDGGLSWWLYQPWLHMVFAILVMLMVLMLLFLASIELDNCFIKSNHNKKKIAEIFLMFLIPYILSNVTLLYGVYYGVNEDYLQIAPIIYFGIFACSIILIIPAYFLIRKSNNYNKFNGIYFPLIILIILLALNGTTYLICVRGMFTVIWVLLIPICTDVGGFFFGIFFGKHKFAKKISPKKTWEGVGGSIFFGMLIPLAAIFLFGIGGDKNIYELQANVLGNQWDQSVVRNASINPGQLGWYFFIALILIFLNICAIFGDLFFSLFKRKNGIKDYSNLIAGHGGILDRIDSWIIVFSAFFSIVITISGISTLSSGWTNYNRIFNPVYLG